jgi:nucleoside-diphosphate-sugar epimerase
MRILITGSSGQVGTNLALRCLESGHEVMGIDCRANDWTDAFEYALHDLSQSTPAASSPGAFVGVECERPDIVVHLAAHAKVHELVLYPRCAIENITMTYNVLEYCRLLNIPVIFASSREVYGDVSRLDTRESDADFACTASTYAASKIAGEAMVYAYARCYDLPYIVFRLSNVYGRYDNDLRRMERVIPLFISKIRDDEAITVFGAEKVIDFTHVDDCIDGIVSGMDRLVDGRVRNQTFNLAFGEGHSLLKMVEYVGDALDKEPQVILARPRTGEITRYVANLEKARGLLDFSPKVPLLDGIRRAVAWSRERSHRHGLLDGSGERAGEYQNAALK